VFDAVQRGAMALNYVEAANWRRDGDGLWSVGLRDAIAGETFEVRTRTLIDATGAWSQAGGLRLVRGSHIVVPRLTSGDGAVASFDRAGRITFFIPWGAAQDLTLVGTTDVDHAVGPDAVRISSDEREYLRERARELFGVRPEVVSTFSSLRPLVDGGSQSATRTSRRRRIWFSGDGMLHIAGGKYTTYRAMSEEAADRICEKAAPALKGVHLTAETPLRPPPRELEMGSIQHLRDYLFVSTYRGYERQWTAEALRAEAEPLARTLGWTEQRLEDETRSVIASLA
jgi:glycerol-3-phosphate dehydrogenase